MTLDPNAPEDSQDIARMGMADTATWLRFLRRHWWHIALANVFAWLLWRVLQ